MFNYIVTVYDGEREVPLSGVAVGQNVDLTDYECRRIYPQDWQKSKEQFAPSVFDPEITGFLDAGYEIHIYRKKVI